MSHLTTAEPSSRSFAATGFRLFLAAFLTLILISEIILRALNLFPVKSASVRPTGWAIVPEESWIEHHPTLGWVHQKNKSSHVVSGQASVPVHTNSLGLRGVKEYKKNKIGSRIYVMGDSFAFGFGVRDDENFSAQMEMMNPSMEVMNFGVPGYGIDQMYLLLTTFGFEFHPDIVVIAIFPEEFWRATRAFTDAGYAKPYFVLSTGGELVLRNVPVPSAKTKISGEQFPDVLEVSPTEKLLKSSAVYRLIQRAWIKLQKRMGREDSDARIEWILGRKILKQMTDEIKQHHARPILMVVPPARWIAGTVEPLRDSLLRFAGRENLEILDLAPALAEAVKKEGIDSFYIPLDNHWTARGHRFAANKLLEYLKENASTYEHRIDS